MNGGTVRKHTVFHSDGALHRATLPPLKPVGPQHHLGVAPRGQRPHKPQSSWMPHHQPPDNTGGRWQGILGPPPPGGWNIIGL